eukprot:TRINITY_DN3486_c0_g1_i1.p1 TRINITY_DN3486_c0_g1~~TRINITY_DN3486_c0_g1_i1.p1  ORF type:complete len:319 (-),score=33.01 TRINITY_DN3486_c0_g1_i1:154-1110(-)
MPSLEWVLPRLRANEITIVDIKFGNIGDEGVRLILDALPVNTSLKTLLLWRNKIGPEGARLLADALRVNTSLKELKLTGNSIGDEGARHLADALRVNVSLEKLSLCATDIGEEGARLLADALSVNVALKLLDLDVGNNVSKARKKEISDLLQPKAREQRAAAAAEKQRQEREAARPATPSTTTTGDPSATVIVHSCYASSISSLVSTFSILSLRFMPFGSCCSKSRSFRAHCCTVLSRSTLIPQHSILPLTVQCAFAEPHSVHSSGPSNRGRSNVVCGCCCAGGIQPDRILHDAASFRFPCCCHCASVWEGWSYQHSA